MAAATVLLGVCAGWAWAQGAGKIKLGAAYKDQVEGFSLRPPLGTERIREPSTSRLVTWAKRDRKTGAIAWTFSVIRVIHAKRKIADLATYGKEVARKLRIEDKFKLESVRMAKTGGKGAFHIRGQTSGISRRWQRQVWVQASPHRFLVFVMTGLPGEKARLDSICDTILQTLDVRDPAAERMARQKTLKRGETLLRGLTEKQFAAAVAGKPQWYLMRIKGKPIGFMLIQSSAAKRAQVKGFEVKTWAMVRPAGGEVRLMKRVLFTTPTRVLEEWKESVQVGDGKSATVASEIGMMTNGTKIVCDVSYNGKVTTKGKLVPAGIYLPRATAMLLPRLADLAKPATYGFATYTTKVNDFDYRAFTVVGADRISIGGKNVDTIRITDQVAADAIPTTLWVEKNGRVLRMENRGAGRDAFVMQIADKRAVTRLFPKAEMIVRSLGK